MLGFGIDLSHHQDPDLLPWKQWRGEVDFVIARACYGARRDENASEHVRWARDIGAKVGLYAFLRNVDPVAAQVSAFHAVADACRLDDGDIVPAVDIERDPIPAPGRDVSPAWSPLAEEMVSELATTWGNALVYITQREWHMMGSPLWVLRRPLWVAHYTSAATPATPGNAPATIWQHRVGPVDPNGPGGVFHDDYQIDQNRLLRPLPLIGQALSADDQARIENQVTAWLASEAERLGEPFPLPKDENT